MRKNRILTLGTIGMLIILFVSFIGPYLPIVDSNLIEEKPFFRYHNGVMEVAPYAPSSDYLLGSDKNGRDLLSLLIVGTRPTLSFVLYVCILRYLLAVPIGLIVSNPSGPQYLRTIVQIWSKLSSYVPTIFIIILLANSPFVLFSEKRTYWMIALIALIEVGRVSEFVSAQIEKIKSEDFVSAGIMVGNRFSGLVVRYFWPHTLPQIVINFSLDVSRTIFLIGQLGIFSIFISHEVAMAGLDTFNVMNTSITWPMLLTNVIQDIRIHPWIPFWTSLFIAFSSFSFYLLSEGLRKKTQFPHS
ncbi:ABC transporter permease [Neobacillus sp. D3-1R]|uniref:ABC transporter permease n=1 Tax=Neobacillus sp. D3-1R TaxID=3445778 RepID=UPI003FA06470